MVAWRFVKICRRVEGYFQVNQHLVVRKICNVRKQAQETSPGDHELSKCPVLKHNPFGHKGLGRAISMGDTAAECGIGVGRILSFVLNLPLKE